LEKKLKNLRGKNFWLTLYSDARSVLVLPSLHVRRQKLSQNFFNNSQQ